MQKKKIIWVIPFKNISNILFLQSEVIFLSVYYSDW